MSECDVAVVGAGPSGLIAAEHIAQEDYKVLILEEHAEVGAPQHCTGKISINALHELGLPAYGLVQQITGATFFAPNLTSFTVRRETPQAIIVDRKAFDQSLLTRATDASAQLWTDSRVTDFQLKSNHVSILIEEKGKKRKITARCIVGADGVPSTIATSGGLDTKNKSGIRLGVQRELVDVTLDSSCVELYFGKRWAPGFFAWIVPTGSTSARVGLAVPPHAPRKAFEYLDDFMANHPIAHQKIKSGRVLTQNAHIIPTGGALQQTVSDGIVVIGDAAGQVKSTTGGGLYFGMTCAKIAGSAIVEALQDANTVLRREILLRYDTEWRKRVGREIAFSVKARRFLDTLTDEEVDYLFHVLQNDKSLIRRIEVTGDIDHQSIVFRSLLRYTKYMIKKPSLIYKLMKFSSFSN